MADKVEKLIKILKRVSSNNAIKFAEDITVAANCKFGPMRAVVHDTLLNEGMVFRPNAERLADAGYPVIYGNGARYIKHPKGRYTF